VPLQRKRHWALAAGDDRAISSESEIRRLQLLPDGLIYHPYLAGPKESRTGIQFFSTDDGGWSWFSSVGGQIGILRFGTYDDLHAPSESSSTSKARPSSAAWTRNCSISARPMYVSVFPCRSAGAVKKPSCHCTSAIQARRQLVRAPADQPDRVFDRQAIVLGHSIRLAEKLRIYGEVGYAFKSELDGEWEFQFGTEFAPVLPTRIVGAPFAAANLYLLEREDFGGSLTLQGGWCWRGKNARLLRVGLFYSNGTSNQALLDDRNEQLFGFGIWHDL
jgi:hypothetical protein